MKSKREQRPQRKMKPVFLVFCEGETEENYLNFVRQTYRSPIKIVAKTEGDKISQQLIDARKKELRITPNETITAFLMYDLDKADILERLNACQAEKLYSNPCVELWFLLHAKEQNAPITTANCIKALQRTGGVWSCYEKPFLTTTQQQFLAKNKNIAIERAKQLTATKNPSSGIFRMLELLAENNK